ncbi:30S ribosomal protein S17 [Candidatus Shapirobacteria bacterium CG_4_10_14_0_8_um_filter_39_15]|nr:MAG: 30S ribosomal protein S17 [Candidatus Shapirobacteria bacterium CG_4_10_14_0_8_um_filter_39_15]
MRTNTGIVVFAKMNKTAAVEIKIMTIHPLYKKRIWKKRKYLVHNDLGAKVGDKVTFVECKPISKRVHWTIVEKLEAGSGKLDIENKKLEVRNGRRKTKDEKLKTRS